MYCTSLQLTAYIAQADQEEKGTRVCVRAGESESESERARERESTYVPNDVKLDRERWRAMVEGEKTGVSVGDKVARAR